MIANLLKILRTNSFLTKIQASKLLNVEESILDKYEEGILVPKMCDLILFSIKTDQEIEDIIKSEIKAYLKSNKHLYISGTIAGLELMHFDFVDQNICFSLVEKWMQSKFSIFELSYLLEISKEIVRAEIKDEISVIADYVNLDDNYQFISWNKYSYLVEKHL